MTVRFSEAATNAVTIFICSLVIFSTLAYVTVVPRPREQFFQIYVLGENRKAERYYPNNNPNIAVGQQVRWHVGATNFMGSVQYIVIKAKLGNSTISAPDDKNHLPSPAPALLEFRRVLLDNETWEFPLTWTMKEIKMVSGGVELALLDMNGARIKDRGVSALRGQNFRVILELWTLDSDSGSLMFGWRAGSERRVAWLQVWFNATSSVAG
jgi:hypothetical protein